MNFKPGDFILDNSNKHEYHVLYLKRKACPLDIGKEVWECDKFIQIDNVLYIYKNSNHVVDGKYIKIFDDKLNIFYQWIFEWVFFEYNIKFE